VGVRVGVRVAVGEAVGGLVGGRVAVATAVPVGALNASPLLPTDRDGTVAARVVAVPVAVGEGPEGTRELPAETDIDEFLSEGLAGVTDAVGVATIPRSSVKNVDR